MKRPGKLSPYSRAASTHSRVYHLVHNKVVPTPTQQLEEKPPKTETYKHFIIVNLKGDCVAGVCRYGFFNPVNEETHSGGDRVTVSRLSLNSITDNVSLTQIKSKDVTR